MARGKRHFIPGYIRHITHRCYKREFLLKFTKDRHRYLQWLYQAKKRYKLTILNYMITANHVHLLVVDSGKGEVIPKSMQLVAGRTGQEYNQRKSRKGAYREDRYHAMAVESGEHLSRCIACIDANMVRASVLDHPSMWLFSGYNEIQKPKRKNILIDYERLQGLFGAESYDQLRSNHKGWIEAYLVNGLKHRQDIWADSIAVGSKSFVEKVKSLLGYKAKGRDVMKDGEAYHLREEAAPYMALSSAEKDDIGAGNTYYWDINSE